MDNISTSNYNANTRTKVAVLAGTALTSGLCVANMMRKKNIKSIKHLEMGIKEGVDLCCASTVGGLGAGLLVDDKRHRKAKLKDSVNQIVGNTFIPFGCLAIANKFTKSLPVLWQTITAIGTLFITTFLGHDIANKINKKVFKEDSNYNCGLKDFATDFDDLFFAASTVMKNKKLYQLTALLCPLTYMTHGYLAGTRQEDKRLDKYV